MQTRREYSDAELLRRWGRLLEAGPRIQNQNTKVVLAKLFENTYRDFRKHGIKLITEAGNTGPDAGRVAPGSRNNILGAPKMGGKGQGIAGYMNGEDSGINGQFTAPYNDYYMPNMIMPMLRRIFPDLIANELVGVQAMNGPTGLVMALRAQYNNHDARNAGIVGDGTLTSDREIGFDSPDVRYTGTSATSADGFGSFADIKAEGAKNGADISSYLGAGDRINAWDGVGQEVNQDSEFASFRDGTYPTCSLGLIRASVVAKTRKLGGQWSPELAEDLDALYGINVESEMTNLITYEVGAEIDRQMVNEMVKAAFVGGNTSAWDATKADGLDQMGRIATLLTQITIQANYIALKTRRGTGNFVIASPKVCAILEQLSMQKYVSFNNGKQVPSVPYSGVGALQKQGLINDGNQLLVRDANATMGDYVLIGYKGQHPGDSGIIYCPYIPLIVQRALVTDTMTPVIGARTRYGVMNNPWDASRYYHFMSIKGMHEEVTWNSIARQFIAPLGGGDAADKLPR